MPPYFPVHAGAWFSAPTCLQKFLPFLKTGELAISNLRFRPISPAKASCGAGKQELKSGLTRYRPTAPDSFVWGELHGSRQLYLKGKFLKKKKEAYIRQLLLENPESVDISRKKEFSFFKENSHSSRATRIRTLKWRSQSPLPYRLAIALNCCFVGVLSTNECYYRTYREKMQVLFLIFFNFFCELWFSPPLKGFCYFDA